MCNCNHEYKLDPELESILYGEYDFENGKKQPQKHIPTAPTKPRCDNEMDITKAFRSFIADAQAAIKKSTTLSQDNIRGIVNMIQAIVSAEGATDIMKYKVLSCSKINNPLLIWGESAGAEIDVANKTLRLTDNTWSLAGDFLSTNDLSSLISFFQIIGHEKRHATLGALIHVTTSALQKGVDPTETSQVEYRVSEILVIAEEIAVGKRMNPKFSVPLNQQQLIRKHFSIVEARVNNTELNRLRNLIIKELRNRYSFKNGCDNPLTLGVLSCMDTGRWHVCSAGSVSGRIPAGLNLCKNKDGTHRVCGIH